MPRSGDGGYPGTQYKETAMKKKQAKKLELSKDTVRKLGIRDFDWRELEQVVGGALSIVICQLTEQSSCCPAT